MDDFYVYYEVNPANPRFATIKAVSPNELTMPGMQHVRISAEHGQRFTMGHDALNNWHIAWNAEEDKMEMVMIEVQETDLTSRPLQQISVYEDNPTIIVEWHRSEQRFVVRAVNVDVNQPQMVLKFFVTGWDNPHIFLHYFPVTMIDAMEVSGKSVPCPVELPHRFSVTTRKVFDRYQLRFLA